MLRPAERPVSPIITGAIALVCLSDIGIAIFYRARLITPSVERLRTNAQDAEAIGQWRKGVILSFAFAESVVLFGFALKVLGAGWNVAGVFFIFGVLLFLAWSPKLDVSD